MDQMEAIMAAPQLSVRSSKAWDIAHRLAARENCTIVDVVVRALEAFETREAGREPAVDFYRRISSQFDRDVGLEFLVNESRVLHNGIEL